MAHKPLVVSKTKQVTHIEERIIVEEVEATHDPIGEMDVDANFALNFMDNIFTFDMDSPNAIQDLFNQQEHIQKMITSHLLQLSFETMCVCLNNDDSHSTTIYLLSLVSKYPWHAKLVIMMASFMMMSGKVEVVSQSSQQKGLTYNLHLLKPMLSPDNKNLVQDLIQSTVDLMALMIQLQQYSLSMLLASYWITRSIVALVRIRILGINSKNQLMEQYNLYTKIKEIMTSSLPLLEAEREEENYQVLLQAFESPSNILDVLKLMFEVKNDEEKPIVYNDASGRVRLLGLDYFDGEGLLLLISSGIYFPYFAYNAPRGVKMVWIPIINDVEEPIQMLDSSIECYCVLDLQKCATLAFKRFLKEKLFQNGGDPVVISLDKRGKLVHYNALHMILTWRDELYEERRFEGALVPSLENELRERTLGVERVIGDINNQIDEFASEVRNKINNWVDNMKAKMKSSFLSYNYTSEMERQLWDKAESWNLKLVFVGAWRFESWIRDDNYIFFIGGNNIKQLKQFALKVRELCSQIQKDMKIAYIGRSRKTSKEVRNVCDWAFYSSEIQIFWTRLQSMVISRIQYLQNIGRDEGIDEIMQQLKKLLSYEANNTKVGVWALLSKGEKLIACDMGDKMLGVMNEYEKWKDNARANGFDVAFNDCYEMFSPSSSSVEHPCCALNCPSNFDEIPETMSCPQCNHNMHKFVTFSCCHGPNSYEYLELV